MRRLAYATVLPLAALLSACSDGTAPKSSDGIPSPVVAGDPFTITLTDLSTQGLTRIPVDVNNSGHVVGSCLDREVPPFFDASPPGGFAPWQRGPAFIWSASGGLQELGTLGGEFSCAAALNDAGVVVGYSSIGGAGGGDFHAFVWTAGGGMHDLGTLPGGTQSRALDVNTAGQIVGWSNAPDGCRHAVMWDAGGSIHDLGQIEPFDGEGEFASQPFSREAMAINDLGEITGQVEIKGPAAPERVPFIWTASGGMERIAVGGSLGFASWALDVSDQHLVAGRVCEFGECFLGAFDFAGALRPLGGSFDPSLSCDGSGALTSINDAGAAVGYCGGADCQFQPFVQVPGVGNRVLPGFETSPLPDGSSFCSPLTEDGRALGLNDEGQIVGSILSVGVMRPVLWTIVPST